MPKYVICAEIPERDDGQLPAEVASTLMLLQASTESVIAEYGWECRVPDSQRRVPLAMSSAAIAGFIDQAIADGAFVYGSCDLHLAAGDGDWEFLLCHESDLHCVSSNLVFLSAAIRHWLSMGLVVMRWLAPTSPPDPTSEAAPGTWQAIENASEIEPWPKADADSDSPNFPAGLGQFESGQSKNAAEYRSKLAKALRVERSAR
ncbi:MAG: hypothetical protein NTZ56_04500 [Acidobacteria bacterium]|nr:hypothetical protein [Acidobacteriota bacterium]